MLNVKFRKLFSIILVFFIFPVPLVYSMEADFPMKASYPFLNEPLVSFLKSNFLKHDPILQQIISKKTDLNLGSLHILKKENGSLVVDRSAFAYKIFSAFQMLGYSSSPKSLEEVDYYHLDLLNQFQQQYGFLVSPILTADVLVKIDQLLAEREKLYQFYAEKFPLLDHLQLLHENDVSAQYIGMLYTLPILALPEHLQMESEQEYYDCIAGQCQGEIVANPQNPQNYFFDNLYFTNKEISGLPPSASQIVTIVLHEYAHYLDEIVSNVGGIDTLGFYEISWEMPSSNHCAYRKTEDAADFITQYGFRGYYASNPCPISGQYKFIEDFADSFAAYVVNGKGFRAAALKNPVLAQKYDWLKANVFYGKEYDTNLSLVDGMGCFYGNSIYLGCDDRYVWDGSLKEVYRPELEIQRYYDLELLPNLIRFSTVPDRA